MKWCCAGFTLCNAAVTISCRSHKLPHKRSSVSTVTLPTNVTHSNKRLFVPSYVFASSCHDDASSIMSSSSCCIKYDDADRESENMLGCCKK